ncbi:MAG: hypothetical protein MK291_13305, partial [Planctomycetes bacterium]|nr:hypothetical protein [Planctomycetota bacterium]
MKSIGDRRVESAVVRSCAPLVPALILSLASCHAPDPEAPLEVVLPRSSPERVEAQTPLQAEAAEQRVARERRWRELCVSAGGTTLPDLPAALVTSRLEERAVALDLLRRDLAGPQGPALRDFFADSLGDPEADALGWAELARASARLSLCEGEEAFVQSLEADSPSRRVAARAALYTLRGVWVVDAVAALALLEGGAPPSAALVDALHVQTERLRAH